MLRAPLAIRDTHHPHTAPSKASLPGARLLTRLLLLTFSHYSHKRRFHFQAHDNTPHYLATLLSATVKNEWILASTRRQHNNSFHHKHPTMVLHKWATVQRTAPPSYRLLPKAKTIPTHPRLKPADYKTPYILRPFVKDLHLGAVQHIENRGMYKEELSIERSRFPRFTKSLVVQTDGSLNEREFEFTSPPLLVLFHDRTAAHRQRLLALAKIGKLRKERSWEHAAIEDGPQPSDTLLCNAVAFPYCVPKHLIPRTPLADPLTAKKSSAPEDSQSD